MFCISLIRGNFLSKSRSILALQSVNYSSESEPRLIDTRREALKRGTGYRSSYNGNVCTVFGASGFVGWALCANLGRHGTQLIVPYRGDPYDVQDLKISGDLGQVLYCPFQLNDEESIKKAIKYSNCVINLIGRDYNTYNWTMDQVHVDGARLIAKACREVGVEKLIHFSALNVDPDPKPIYLPSGSHFYRTKWFGEIAVREEFPDAVIIRPSDIFGENDKFIQYYGDWTRCVMRTLYLVNCGEGVIKRPIWLDDVTEAVYEIVRRNNDDVKGKTYQFFGPRAYYLSDLCDYMLGCMWKDEDWGYSRGDARTAIVFQLWLEFQNLFRSRPRCGISKERFEREHHSDIVLKDLPTIRDLGTKRHPLPDVIAPYVIYDRAYQDYAEETHEFVFPPEPKVVEYF